jgi:hypothetical protein
MAAGNGGIDGPEATSNSGGEAIRPFARAGCRRVAVVADCYAMAGVTIAGVTRGSVLRCVTRPRIPPQCPSPSHPAAAATVHDVTAEHPPSISATGASVTPSASL